MGDTPGLEFSSKMIIRIVLLAQIAPELTVRIRMRRIRLMHEEVIFDEGSL